MSEARSTFRVVLATLLCASAMSCSRGGAEGRAQTVELGAGWDPSSSLPFFTEPSLTPRWLSREEASDPRLHAVREDFRGVDQHGSVVTGELLRGRIQVVDFFFTGCGGICPVLSRHLARVQEALEGDDDVVLLSHSVLPEQDTVERLRGHAATYGARRGRWHLVRGERSLTHRIAREDYFADFQDGEVDENAFVHTEKVYLVDRARRIRGVYNGTRALDMDLLVEDVRRLQEESR